MTESLNVSLHWGDWLNVFAQYLTLSLLAVGGAITTAPEMHRYLVEQHSWMTDAQFTASIAIAQAAPGPNVLFVALLGWQLGINSGGLATGLLGVAITMVGIMLPSTTLAYLAAQWGHRNRDLRAVRAFKRGMSPVVIALLIATGWVLASVNDDPATDWPLWLATAVSTILMWRTKIHLLWLLGAGAILGATGVI